MRKYRVVETAPGQYRGQEKTGIGAWVNVTGAESSPWGAKSATQQYLARIETARAFAERQMSGKDVIEEWTA